MLGQGFCILFHVKCQLFLITKMHKESKSLSYVQVFLPLASLMITKEETQ